MIHHQHGSKAKHLESIAVKESFQGRPVLDGVVAVFNLRGHPKTDRIYAWIHQTDDQVHPRRHVTVLNIRPVVSPKTAVQAAIVREFKERGETN